ncbi:hypothetical protein EZ313_17330 [Ramlibacter henchirensis]|uniref:Uncharacterized protein n=1 Tax=Ramlibacter henchirensis TaxID=204072 RepID=A0A4Z0BY85_9BURK|nr:hypothetical protein [Ramlibacter henchirensis]TFZ02985.1 hypothetical protein EZ313_17330 [Ramlibacter henchirensis]
MRLAIDIDAAAKLAHWGLLPHIPALLNTDWKGCITLTSLRFRAQKALQKPDGRVFHCTEAAQVALDLCASVGLPPDVTLLTELQDVQGIDAGEAVLLSAMHMDRDLCLLTGDKRALRALSAAAPELRGVFAGRVVTVEQVLGAALNRFGLLWLRQNVCPYRHIDKAILIIMGSRCDAGEPSVREAIDAYVMEVRALCDPSLLYPLGD